MGAFEGVRCGHWSCTPTPAIAGANCRFSRCNLHRFPGAICTIFQVQFAPYLHQNGANPCANCTRYLHHFWCKSNVQFAPKMMQITCAICTEMVQIKCAICTKLVQIHGAICTCICTILVQILVQIRCKWHWDLHHFGANMSANGTWICTILVQILVQTRCNLHLDLHHFGANGAWICTFGVQIGTPNPVLRGLHWAILRGLGSMVLRGLDA